MRSLLLIGAVLGVVLGGCYCQDDAYTSYRLGALESAIEDVEERVKGVNDYWDNTIAPKSAAYVKLQQTLRSTVQRLEGDHAGEDRWHCESGESIGNLLVCDGSADCADGSDEDDHLCTIETPAGTVLEGRIYNEDGCTKRRPNKMRAVVNYAYAYPWMPNRVVVGASIIVSFMKDGAPLSHTFAVNGQYHFGDRELYLEPVEDDRLAVRCRFNGIRHDVCVAEIYHEASDQACATFIMKRLEFDSPDH